MEATVVQPVKIEALSELKLAMLAAETTAQLTCLITDYTHEEIMQVYRELRPEQQNRIATLWHWQSQHN